ncbi:hypothetical protein C2845_PM18G03260 [Panicum miliaceum]|uniref:Uncharacterized protein n=1 Tax=Panicum miliaceum TaxID=4540 RepID=A0A3L6PJ06_PANMI|nr:hypothetical protein C2845_PM18G03260 [Panicum miliaceum]
MEDSDSDDRLSQLKAFDDTKAGVKGLVDAGVATVPPIFRHPPDPHAASATTTIPVVDLGRADLGLLRAAAETVGFFQVVNRSLLSAVNADGETPLLTAVTSGHNSLASFLMKWCRDLQLSEAILKQDERGYNALHHAIRSGHRELALELIAAEPALSKAVNRKKESPMFMAVMRNYADVLEKLLEVPESAHGGACGWNALHAAVRNGN